jgi:hypothetical protein
MRYGNKHAGGNDDHDVNQKLVIGVQKKPHGEYYSDRCNDCCKDVVFAFEHGCYGVLKWL